MVKYSEVVCKILQEQNYTHCFFVAGGNIMHLLESASRYFICIPVVHEVAAGIAVEYFNECETDAKAFALVTAGPGLTNIITAIAGAYLESRDLLVLGGQVKTSDLTQGKLRQRGIQEIDGIALTKPITKFSNRLYEPAPPENFLSWVEKGTLSRKGPVFLEIPLDIQAREVSESWLTIKKNLPKPLPCASEEALLTIKKMLFESLRPVVLIGGGITRKSADNFLKNLNNFHIPIMTTWNASDRIDSHHPLYFGRPNTWGQRFANLLLQQADCVLALGTRLSMQQTGFNWQKFVPHGKIIQIDCDSEELKKGHPHTAFTLCADANKVLETLSALITKPYDSWLDFCYAVKKELPLNEIHNKTGIGYLSPYSVVEKLSLLTNDKDTIIPCSSGGAFTVMMQTFAQTSGQIIISNKGLASMGYGLSGAIGAAIAKKGNRIILVEGDGGFMQNLQELGTVYVNKLNLKIFIFNDNGYASIRMTQKNYFQGKYMGCDIVSGLGMPQWEYLFAAYNIPLLNLKEGFEKDFAFMEIFNKEGPAAFLIPIDPDQTYYPKISSSLLANGNMESHPLHRMTPALSDEVMERVGLYLVEETS